MIEGIPVVGMTAPTLLGIAILFLMTGRLIPRSHYREKVLEAERWRQAYEAEREARSTSDAQTVELLEFAKTNHSVMEAMFQSIREIRGSGGSDVVHPKEA